MDEARVQRRRPPHPRRPQAPPPRRKPRRRQEPAAAVVNAPGTHHHVLLLLLLLMLKLEGMMMVDGDSPDGLEQSIHPLVIMVVVGVAAAMADAVNMLLLLVASGCG